MRQRLRSHLTYANVMASLAVFIALGGTALASVIITKNSQVASNTISGHKPPTGKHANLIANSVNSQDVKDLEWHTLTLKNGWASDVGFCTGSGTAQIAMSVEGVVHFRGAICQQSGSSNNAFAVPTGFEPTKWEDIVVDQTNGATGRIEIQPTTGETTVFGDPDPDQAGAETSFTSLDGVSYTLPY